MTGAAFYEFLYDTFRLAGACICEGFIFQGWVTHGDGSASLQYAEFDGTIRSLSRDILIAAWDADLLEEEISAMWESSSDYPSDSRMILLQQLIRRCAPLRLELSEEAYRHAGEVNI